VCVCVCVCLSVFLYCVCVCVCVCLCVGGWVCVRENLEWESGQSFGAQVYELMLLARVPSATSKKSLSQASHVYLPQRARGEH
jgi:hypothetical protein